MRDVNNNEVGTKEAACLYVERTKKKMHAGKQQEAAGGGIQGSVGSHRSFITCFLPYLLVYLLYLTHTPQNQISFSYRGELLVCKGQGFCIYLSATQQKARSSR